MTSGLLVAGLLLAVVPPPAADEILARPEYAFCHDDDYPLTEREAEAWCPLLGTAGTSRCPAFAETCDAPRAQLQGWGRMSSRRAEQSSEDATSDPDKRGRGRGPDRRRERDREDADLDASALQGPAQVLFWALLLAAVAVFVVVVLRNAVRGDAGSAREPEDPAVPDEGGDANADPAAAVRAMETDVGRLLDLARQSAQRQEFSDAVDYAHAALLRRLDHEGLIRLHLSRTNGDYIRDLRVHAKPRAQGALTGAVRDVLRDVDRAQFGPEPPGASVFASIHARVVEIVKTVGPLALLLVAGLGSTSGCDPSTTRSHPWSTSPSGTEGVVELLRADGRAVTYRAESLVELAEREVGEAGNDPALVVLPDTHVTDEEWDALAGWVEVGGRLVLAGAGPAPWPHTPKATSGVEPDEASLELYGPWAMLPVTESPDDDIWSFRGLDLDPARGFYGDYGLDANGVPYVAWVEDGLGEIIVLADGNLFTNAALAFGENPDRLRDLFDPGQDIEFVDEWTSKGAQTPAEGIARTHLTAAVVQLLLFVLAFYAWRGAKFGRSRDPVSVSRRAFAEHAEAMGRQYRRAGAAHYASALFSAWMLERLRNRFSSAARGGLLGLGREVARVSGRDETDVMRLLVEAHGAAELVGQPSANVAAFTDVEKTPATAHLALIRDLAHLMRELHGNAPNSSSGDPS